MRIVDIPTVTEDDVILGRTMMTHAAPCGCVLAATVGPTDEPNLAAWVFGIAEPCERHVEMSDEEKRAITDRLVGGIEPMTLDALLASYAELLP